MSLITLTAAKGAPGVTTTALALAAVWPVRPLLAECDPSGADLLWRLRAPDGGLLDRRRGVLSLAADRVADAGAVWRHTQPVAGGLDVLLGVPGWDEARALGRRWEPIAEALTNVDADVLADCGRLTPDSPALPVIGHARLVVCVTRPSVDAVAHARGLLTRLASLTARVLVLVVADLDERHLVREVQAALDAARLPVGVRVIDPLASDPPGTRLLYGGPAAKLQRTWLIRTARPLADTLANLAAEPTVEVTS